VKEFWNIRYKGDEYIYGKEPNKFFAECIRGLEPGKVLLPAEGEGRNAVYAAKMGWDVYAFDFSEHARTKALRLALQSQVFMSYEIASCNEFQAPQDFFDLGAVFFLQLPALERKGFHKKLINWTKPGGKIIGEYFSKKQYGLTSGGPQNPNLLCSIEELQNDFKSLNIQLLEEKKIVLDEGISHKGDSWVIRVIAEK
jgi:Methyltransferase domain